MSCRQRRNKVKPGRDRSLALWFVGLAAWFLATAPAMARSAQGAAETEFLKARGKYYSLITSRQTGDETEWQVCVEMFRKVSTNYPESRRAADALFTEGLLYWNMHQRFGRQENLYQAVQAYERLVDNHPRNPLADDALYNIGVIYYKDMGDKDRAVNVLERLKNDYPRSEMATQARQLLTKIRDGASTPAAPSVTPPSTSPSFLPSGTSRYQAPKLDKPEQPSAITETPTAPAPKSMTTSAIADSTAPLKIEDIRFWSNPDYTRVSIYLNHGASFSHRMLKKDPQLKTPYRLYVDVNGAKLASGIQREISIKDSLLQQVRSGQFKPEVARVVLDMNSVYDYQISSRNDPDRIIIDIQGQQPKPHPLPTPSEPIAVAPEPTPTTPNYAPQFSADKPTNFFQGEEAKQAAQPTPSPTPTTLTPPIAPQIAAVPTSTPTSSSVQPSMDPVASAIAVASAPTATPTPPAIIKSGELKQSSAVDLKSVSSYRTIIIDAGHGGDDPGAKGPSGTMEKEVVLDIALKLRDALANYKGVRVVMTRDSDIFIPLQQRSLIANQARGDLFISIHANASPKRQVSGISTYIFDNAKDEYSKRLEETENASIMRGEKEEPDFLNLMFKSMTKNYFTNQSVELASTVQGQIVSGLKTRYSSVRDLGVRQAMFYVLWNTEMPAILVETSFISNRTEENRLRSGFYQLEMARSIAAGAIKYLENRFAIQITQK